MSTSDSSLLLGILSQIPDQLLTQTRLLLVVGITEPVSSLPEIQLLDKAAYVNVNLELSRQLRHKIAVSSLECTQFLYELLASCDAEYVLLDRLEILFTPALQLDVLRLLLDLNRNKRIIAVWPGEYNNVQLTYAIPGHPEYREYQRPEAVFPVTILSLRR